MKKQLILVTATAALLATSCSNAQEEAPSSSQKAPSAGTLTVSSTADACEVSSPSTQSGTTTFSITNDGTQTTEFYLLASDGLRIVAEKENIAPGASADLTVTLQPGDYYTACKPGMRGGNVDEQKFAVTGDKIELSGEDQELYEAAVADYVNFAKNEVAQLPPLVKELTDAYIAGDDEKAKEMFAPVRLHYERIEPIAEALGILDPRIDYREIDYLAEADALKADDPTFTEWLGFHRMEKDLWVPDKDAVQPDGTSAYDGWKPSTPEDRKRIGETLVEDIDKLYEMVHADDFIEANNVSIATVSNGTSGLLEEIAVNKVTGEENWWSHKDLYDFQANLDGARIAFDLVKPIAERKDSELTARIDEEFTALQELLNKYGNAEEGFVSYDEVDSEQQRELINQIDATREPLSQLTATILEG